MVKGKTIKELKVGDSASFTKTVTVTDDYLYAGITGDFNPAHIDEEYSKQTFFKTRIVHGMLTGGFISTVLGTKLPGPGTIYLSQTMKFTAPCRHNDTITATCTIKEIIEERNRVILDTVCTNQNGEVVLKGEAEVLAPK